MLMQGSLEASNVNVVEEMVNMIETQRAYEINSKAISAADGMLGFICCRKANMGTLANCLTFIEMVLRRRVSNPCRGHVQEIRP